MQRSPNTLQDALYLSLLSILIISTSQLWALPIIFHKKKEIIKYIEVLFWHHLAGIFAKKEMREKERKNKEL